MTSGQSSILSVTAALWKRVQISDKVLFFSILVFSLQASALGEWYEVGSRRSGGDKGLGKGTEVLS